MTPAQVATVADAWGLIDAVPSQLIAAAPVLVAPLAGLLARAREEALDEGDVAVIHAILPIVMGLPVRSNECRDRVVASWFASPAQRAETLAAIARIHQHGHCLIERESDGLWAPRRLLAWLPEDLLPAAPTRWKLAGDFPVPVQQRLARGLASPMPAGGSDIRPALVAGTLTGLRRTAAAWAARFAWDGQPLAEILAIGSCDGLSAAALLLHRGSRATDGWHEARRLLGLGEAPGWAGAVMERCGWPEPNRVHQPQAAHAWMTADFEEADGERSSSTATAAGPGRQAASRGG